MTLPRWREERIKSRQWTTMDGRIISVELMTDSHVENARNYLQRHLDKTVQVWEKSILITGREDALAFTHDDAADFWEVSCTHCELRRPLQEWVRIFDAELAARQARREPALQAVYL